MIIRILSFAIAYGTGYLVGAKKVKLKAGGKSGKSTPVITVNSAAAREALDEVKQEAAEWIETDGQEYVGKIDEFLAGLTSDGA